MSVAPKADPGRADSGQTQLDASAPPPGALLTEPQIQWLRRAVVVMTAILVAGVALLIGRVIYLARAPGTQGLTQAGTPMLAQPPLLPAVRLALPAGSVVKSASLSGSRLVVVHSVPGAADAIIIYDLTTGQVASRVTLEPAP